MAWGDHDQIRTQEQLLANVPSFIEGLRSDGDFRVGKVDHQNLRDFIYTIFNAPPPGSVGTDDVTNDSTVVGANCSDALEQLDSDIAGLGSDDIANESTVTGATVSDALETLAGVSCERFFDASNRNGILDNYATKVIASTSSGYFSFLVPADFGSLVDAELIYSPEAGAAQTGRDIDLFTSYGPDAGGIDDFGDSDTSTTYDMSTQAGEWHTIDISGVLTSLAAGHRVGLMVDHNLVGGNIHYLGIRLVYNKA